MGDLSQFKEVPKGYEFKAGDTILVELSVDDYDGLYLQARNFNDQKTHLQPSDIIAIRERPIEPKCRVNIIGRERGDPYTAEVLSVDRNYAFVLITGGTGEWHHEVLGFDELERI